MIDFKIQYHTNEEIEKRAGLLNVLEERYKECGVKVTKHLDPDEVDNRCNHCYRTLHYYTPRKDGMLEERKNLPLWRRPFDAPYLRDIAKEEIDLQKMEDRNIGLALLEKELTSR